MATHASDLNAVYEAGALGREHAAAFMKKNAKAIRSDRELAQRLARAYAAAVLVAVESAIPGGTPR